MTSVSAQDAIMPLYLYLANVLLLADILMFNISEPFSMTLLAILHQLCKFKGWAGLLIERSVEITVINNTVKQRGAVAASVALLANIMFSFWECFSYWLETGVIVLFLVSVIFPRLSFDKLMCFGVLAS